MQSKPDRLWPDALLLSVLFLLLALLPAATHWLDYRRELIAGGEVWRLFSGHFTHLNLAHAVMNAAGLLLVLPVAMFWSMVASPRLRTEAT